MKGGFSEEDAKNLGARMSYVYFKQKTYHQLLLPEPTGPLSETIPSSRIEVVNSVVEPLVEKASDECSSLAKIYPDRPLKESTVRGWKNQHNREVGAGHISL